MGLDELDSNEKAIAIAIVTIFLSVLLSFSVPIGVMIIFDEQISVDGRINFKILWVILASILLMSPINFFAIRHVINKLVVGKGRSKSR